jgi:hypothetical protein
MKRRQLTTNLRRIAPQVSEYLKSLTQQFPALRYIIQGDQKYL